MNMTQNRTWVTLAPNGRLVIPAELRARLGLQGGEKLTARVVDGALVLEPREAAIRRARALVAKYVPRQVSLADELIAERREEALRE